jgi:hypothetical protein
MALNRRRGNLGLLFSSRLTRAVREMRAVLQQLAPTFEKSSGHKLMIEYATAGKVEEPPTR